MIHSHSTARRSTALAFGLALAFASTADAAPLARGGPQHGALYTASNDPAGNEVIAYRRALGLLVPQGSFATGGTGTGMGLGNQGALAISEDGSRLLVVNAGSDSVSLFDIEDDGLSLVDVEPSLGVRPTSLTVHGDLVYVLNAGGRGNIAGFRMTADGLEQQPGSVRRLSSGDSGAAQISFTPDGGVLVVSERFTDRIVTYVVGADGNPGSAQVQPSQGATPFGFDFDAKGRLLVSEANGGADGASTVSSYEVAPDGTLTPLTSALATGESAACWLVTTPHQSFAYVTNTASDTVSGLAISNQGQLGLVGRDGALAASGDGPIDAGISREGRFLFVLNGGDDSIGAYFIQGNGKLVALGTTGGLPSAVNGLALR